MKIKASIYFVKNQVMFGISVVVQKQETLNKVIVELIKIQNKQ